MSEKLEFKLEADTSEAMQDLQQLDTQAKITASEVMSITKRSYESLVLLGDLFGQTIPVYMNMLVESLFMASEALITLATAESVTVIGLAKAGITFAMAAMLFYRAVELRGKTNQMTNKLNTVIQIARTWVY